MVEQLKQYDLFARNLFATIVFVKEKYENDFTINRLVYKEILNHLTKDIPILVTTDDVIREYNKIYKDLGGNNANNENN